MYAPKGFDVKCFRIASAEAMLLTIGEFMNLFLAWVRLIPSWCFGVPLVVYGILEFLYQNNYYEYGTYELIQGPAITLLFTSVFIVPASTMSEILQFQKSLKGQLAVYFLVVGWLAIALMALLILTFEEGSFVEELRYFVMAIPILVIVGYFGGTIMYAWSLNTIEGELKLQTQRSIFLDLLIVYIAQCGLVFGVYYLRRRVNRITEVIRVMS